MAKTASFLFISLLNFILGQVLVGQTNINNVQVYKKGHYKIVLVNNLFTQDSSDTVRSPVSKITVSYRKKIIFNDSSKTIARSLFVHTLRDIRFLTNKRKSPLIIAYNFTNSFEELVTVKYLAVSNYQATLRSLQYLWDRKENRYKLRTKYSTFFENFPFLVVEKALKLEYELLSKIESF